MKDEIYGKVIQLYGGGSDTYVIKFVQENNQYRVILLKNSQILDECLNSNFDYIYSIYLRIKDQIYHLNQGDADPKI